MNEEQIMSSGLLLKKGRIEITKVDIETTGNAHTVRILPDMEAMVENPTYLPRYGSFFLETQRLYDYGDIVWVLCSADYQVGYILGQAEASGGHSISSLLTRINDAEKQFGLDLSDIRSADITSATDQYIDFVNKTYGHTGRIMNSGAVTMIGKDGSIYVFSKGVTIKLLADGTLQEDAVTIEQNVKTIKEKSASHTIETQGYIEQISGSKKESIGTSLCQSIGGDTARTVAGDESNTIFKSKKETCGTGYSMQVVVGNIDVTSIIGAINLKSLLGINLQSTQIDLKAIKITTGMGMATPGTPGPFCSLPACLFAGAPHTSNQFVGLPF